MKSLKLLIISGATGKLNEMEEFSCALEKLGVNCKIVQESDFGQGFPSKDFANWFNTKTKKLLNEFKPDAVYVDRQAHFCVQAINSKIPVFVHLRGHYWQEIEAAKKTIYKSKIMHLVIWLRDRIAKKCFEKSTIVLPNCTYLKNVVEEHHQHQSERRGGNRARLHHRPPGGPIHLHGHAQGRGEAHAPRSVREHTQQWTRRI